MYLVQAEKLSNLKPLPFQDYVTVFVKAFYIQVCKSKQLCTLRFYIRRLNSSNGLQITLNTRPLNCGRWCRFFRLFFCFCEGLCTLTFVSIGCYCFIVLSFPLRTAIFQGVTNSNSSSKTKQKLNSLINDLSLKIRRWSDFFSTQTQKLWHIKKSWTILFYQVKSTLQADFTSVIQVFCHRCHSIFAFPDSTSEI